MRSPESSSITLPRPSTAVIEFQKRRSRQQAPDLEPMNTSSVERFQEYRGGIPCIIPNAPKIGIVLFQGRTKRRAHGIPWNA